MLTRRPYNLGLVPAAEAPAIGATFRQGDRAYTVDRLAIVMYRGLGTPVPMMRVYGTPIPEPKPARRKRRLGLLAVGLALAGTMFATTDAHAISTAQYVHRAAAHHQPVTASKMAWHAHGKASRCDFDGNGRYGRKQAECVVRVYWRHDHGSLANAFRVIRGESGWNPRNVSGPNGNGTYDCGLFQINTIHYPCRVMLNVLKNVAFAHRLWVGHRRHWSPTWVAASKLGIR